MKREARKQETSSKVLRTAGRLFRENGFAGTTVRDIAAASDVSVGTVISVGDKETLLVASFDQLIAAIHADRAQSSRTSDGGCAEQTAALFDPFVDVFADQPALARTYGAILVAGQTDSVVFSELAHTLMHEIEATLLHTSRAGAETIPALAQGIYYAYIGCLFTWSPTDADAADELKCTLRRVVSAICPEKENS